MSSEAPEPLKPESASQAATPPRPAGGTRPQATGGRQTLQSADLLCGAAAVEIEHLGQIYRLQTTRSGKLILTK